MQIATLHFLINFLSCLKVLLRPTARRLPSESDSEALEAQGLVGWNEVRWNEINDGRDTVAYIGSI